MASQSSNASISITSKIESAPEEFVRAVLIALCQNYSQERKAKEYFASLESKQAEDESGTKESQRNKRKRTSKIRICVQCKDAFKEEENEPEACPYHPGSSTLFSCPPPLPSSVHQLALWIMVSATFY